MHFMGYDKQILHGKCHTCLSKESYVPLWYLGVSTHLSRVYVALYYV